MAFHLAGYYESQDSATLATVAALADQSLTVFGDNIQVPEFAPYLVGAMALGANTTRAQLQSPSLRRVVNYEIRGVNVGAEPLSPPVYNWFAENPIPLDAGEQIQALAAEDAAGAAAETVLVWFSDGQITPTNGDIYSVRVTSATTLTANAWTNGAITFDQVLPIGRYAIVGARFESAGLVAFRFVFQGYAYRPGGIGCDAAADIEAKWQRKGKAGVWGEFHSNTPPTVDFLSISADTSEVGTLDLIQLG